MHRVRKIKNPGRGDPTQVLRQGRRHGCTSDQLHGSSSTSGGYVQFELQFKQFRGGGRYGLPRGAFLHGDGPMHPVQWHQDPVRLWDPSEWHQEAQRHRGDCKFLREDDGARLAEVFPARERSRRAAVRRGVLRRVLPVPGHARGDDGGGGRRAAVPHPHGRRRQLPAARRQHRHVGPPRPGGGCLLVAPRGSSPCPDSSFPHRYTAVSSQEEVNIDSTSGGSTFIQVRP